MEDKDFSKIVKSIGYGKVKNKYNGNVSYKLNVELINNTNIAINVDKGDIDYLKTLRQLNNGAEPVVDMKLVRCTNDEGKEYNCVKVKLINDDILKYVQIPFNYSKIIDLLINSTQVESKVENKNK